MTLPRRSLLLALPGLLLARQATAQAEPPPIAARANALGERLLGAQAAGRGSVAVSPLSLLDALGPLSAGARGATTRSLATLLGANAPAEALALHQALSESAGLTRAAAVWLPKGQPPLPGFSQAVAPLGVGVEAVDFAAPATLGQINGWVAARTNGLIPDLIDRLPANASLVVTAALHFAARWATPFQPGETRPARFTQADGRRREVPFMRDTRVLPYAEARGWQAIRLDYAVPGFELVILVPAPGQPARQMAEALGERRALSRLATMRFMPTEVELALPRLALSHGADLLPMLRRTALRPAFGAEANYRGITGAGVQISAVRQRVVLKLDEAGTEAAASTGIIGSRGMIERARFTADRPFLAMVAHKPTGLHIVTALVNEPGAP